MTDDHHSSDFIVQGEGELYEDGIVNIDTQDNENGYQDQQHKHDMTKEQMMDQAVERKSTVKSEAAEALGVAWAEGSYSGKNLRSKCLLVWAVTILFIGIGISFMLRGWMSNHGMLYWTLLLFIPVCAWVWFGCIYIYRTKTIRYRLTQHRFYNEEGFFTKTVDTLELINIEDMTLRQTFVDRMVNGGTGTIILISNDQSHPTLKITGIESPRAAFESIDELRRRERNARVIRSVN